MDGAWRSSCRSSEVEVEACTLRPIIFDSARVSGSLGMSSRPSWQRTPVRIDVVESGFPEEPCITCRTS